MKESEIIIIKPIDSDKFIVAKKLIINADDFNKTQTFTLENCKINMDLLHKYMGVQINDKLRQVRD